MHRQVFLSYRHESPEHARAVRRLGELLREAGIPVALDQFYLDENPGGPDEGWPKWCEDRANASGCVLIIASAGWFAAYDKKEAAGRGLGAASEADLFRQALYDEAGHNARIRLAFLHEVPAEEVPPRLRAWHQFRPNEADQLDQMVRWVAGRLGLQDVEAPTVRWPEPAPFHPDLADRTEREWPAVVELLAGRSRERILLFEGKSGLGKSFFVHQAAAYAEAVGIPSVRVNFKGGGLDLGAVLNQFDLDLGGQLPNFSRERNGHQLRKDLRALRLPVLVILDSYEEVVGNKPVTDWLELHLLAEVETALGLTVIVAGQKVPDFRQAAWRDLACHLPLWPITDFEPWEKWIVKKYPAFKEKGADLRTVLMGTGGAPNLVAAFCDAVANSEPAL